MVRFAFALLAVLQLSSVVALQNSVALTPPLGWLSWQRYRCTRNCTNDDSNCFNEKLIKATIDAMDSEGYKAAGYRYVALDDCWQAPARENGHVVSDPVRFPSGIKALAKYAHDKGLLLGLYTAMGNSSCAAHSYDKGPVEGLGLGCDFDTIPNCTRAKRDIEDFVSWDIDWLKIDGCWQFDKINMNSSYAIVGQYLSDAVSKRGTNGVVYHPSNLGFSYPRQFRELAAIGNQWRWFDDVQDNWKSVSTIIAEIGAGQPECKSGPLPANCSGFLSSRTKPTSMYCASFCVERDRFLAVPQPGGWHDPDMLLVGATPCEGGPKTMHCNQLTADEELTQMTLWSFASAPLFMSNDLLNVPPASKRLLQHAGLLAINQDPLGRMCFRFMDRTSIDGAQGWKKELAGGDVAIALLNMGSNPLPAGAVSFDLTDAGFAPDTHVAVHDVYSDKDLGWFKGSYKSQNAIATHGATILRLSFTPQYTPQREL